MDDEKPSTENESENIIQILAKRIFFAGLTRSLLLWFLLLALLPLTMVSWFSYQKSEKSLHDGAMQAMTQRIVLQKRFIKNWFSYRFLDLQYQAENESNIIFLSKLKQALDKSGKSPKDFVGSNSWNPLIISKKIDMMNLTETYDYYLDVLFIDDKGNILFSLAEEADLGSNLFTGSNKESRFAKTARRSFEEGLSLFSDLENYIPGQVGSRRGIVTAFMIAPLIDKNNNKVGLYAIKIDVDKINSLMADRRGNLPTEVSYLVGSDLLLRSAISTHPEGMVLQTKIDTEQTRLWKSKPSSNNQTKEAAFSYPNAFGEKVLGIHYSVKIGNINWGLIAEVGETAVLAPAKELGKLTLSMLVLVFFVVILLAIILSNKLVKPIRQLAFASSRMAEGHLTQKVDVRGKNEISQLAEAFNQMMATRQRYVQALEESNQKSQKALNDLAIQKFALDQHAMVVITDTKGDITFANEKFIAISGYSHDDIIGRSHRIFNTCHHPASFFRDMYKTISSGKVWHGEVCNRARNGKIFWLDTTIVPFKGSNGEPESYILLCTDITDRRKVEDELIMARDAAKEAARLKSEFLASMSHEIRTPMNGIIGMLGLLVKSGLSDEQRHHALLARSSADSLLTLINDILDFSKVEAGKMELERVDFDLRSLLSDLIQSMVFQAHDKGLELVLDVTKVDHSMVKGDPGRIRQILTNLLSNATKFTPKGEILTSAALKVVNDDNLLLKCTVTDPGIGIPLKKQAHLFDSFTQVDASTTRQYGGTGLGLAIVKQLCELMGGGVSVSSTPGEGSCFEFSVLMQCSHLSQAVQPDVNITDMPILIVDENTTNRKILRDQLEHWGAVVTEAADGIKALKYMEDNLEKPFALALLDMYMPDMDGVTLAKNIRKNTGYNSTRLIMMTSMGRMRRLGDAEYFKCLGFSSHCSKPVTTDGLINALTASFETGESAQTSTATTELENKEDALGEQKNLLPATSEKYRLPDDLTRNAHILLVEDNHINQLLAQSLLKEMGLNCDIAQNGVEAMKVLKKSEKDKSYTLILMDCLMPEMDGYEATRQIRLGLAGEGVSKLPIIAITANAIKGDKEKCLDAGMNDYLSKPIDPNEMKKIIFNWLGKERSVQTIDKVKHGNTEREAHNKEDSTKMWDKKDALYRLVGNEKLLYLLVKIFIDEMPERIEELRQAIETGNMNEAVALAHTVKGSAGNIGGVKLQLLAAELEATAERENGEHLNDLWPEFYEQYRQLNEHFLQALKEKKPD